MLCPGVARVENMHIFTCIARCCGAACVEHGRKTVSPNIKQWIFFFFTVHYSTKFLKSATSACVGQCQNCSSSREEAIFSSGLCPLIFPTGDCRLNQWNYTSQQTDIIQMSKPLQHYGKTWQILSTLFTQWAYGVISRWHTAQLLDNLRLQ